MRHQKITTGRDPFARVTVRKRLVHISYSHSGCRWCGNYRENAAGRYLWQYYVDADSARESGDIPGLFCSLDCANSYHG